MNILEESLNEKELSETKNYKKIKYSISIIAFTLIIAAVITLSICLFKIEIKEEETKPTVRNLVLYPPETRIGNLGSFKVGGQTVSIRYRTSSKLGNFANEILISSGLGSFKFGKSDMSNNSGSKNYMTPIFKITLPQIPNYLVTGYAKGSLSWELCSSIKKRRYELSGALNLYVEMTPLSGTNVKVTCEGKGTLAEIKGRVIFDEKQILLVMILILL